MVWDSKGTLEFHKGIPGIQTTTPNQQLITSWTDKNCVFFPSRNEKRHHDHTQWGLFKRTTINHGGAEPRKKMRGTNFWRESSRLSCFKPGRLFSTFRQLFWMNILAEEVNISKMSSGSKKNTSWLYVCFGRTEMTVTSFLGYPQVNRILEFSWLFWTNAGWWNI